jgi:hypothetical protein
MTAHKRAGNSKEKRAFLLLQWKTEKLAEARRLAANYQRWQEHGQQLRELEQSIQRSLDEMEPLTWLCFASPRLLSVTRSLEYRSFDLPADPLKPELTLSQVISLPALRVPSFFLLFHSLDALVLPRVLPPRGVLTVGVLIITIPCNHRRCGRTGLDRAQVPDPGRATRVSRGTAWQPNIFLLRAVWYPASARGSRRL